MKKLLLLAAAAMTMAANAEVVVDATVDFSKLDAYNMWKSESTNLALTDGALVVTNETASANFWDVQFETLTGLNLTEGQEYTLTAVIKSGIEGGLHFNVSTWSSKAVYPMANLEVTDDFKTYAMVFTAPETVEGAHVLAQSGDLVGTYAIQSITVSHEAEGGETPVVPVDPVQPEDPATGNVLAAFYTGNGQTMIAWGSDAWNTNAEEEGKHCLTLNQPVAAENSWSVQCAIDMEAPFEYGTTYYLSFEVKGTPATGITSGFQCTDNYAGHGDFAPFNITEEWTRVVIAGECVENGKPEDVTKRIVFNFGKYEGTFYLTDLTLYTAEQSGVNAVAAEQGAQGVYNLMGVKVLDSAEGLRELPKGIYIVNGKKVMK